MQRLNPVAVRESGWLEKRYKTAQKAIRAHKIIHSLPQATLGQKRRDYAQVHRYTAEVKRENTKRIVGILYRKKLESLFKDFDCKQKQPDRQKNALVLFLVSVSKPIRGEEGRGSPADKKQNMERPPCFGRRHRYFQPLKKTVNHFHVPNAGMNGLPPPATVYQVVIIYAICRFLSHGSKAWFRARNFICNSHIFLVLIKVNCINY